MSGAFRLACIQLTAGDDLAANIATAIALARAARSDGADFIAFPECVSMMTPGRSAVMAAAVEEENHPALAAFQTFAAETGAWLLAGTLSIRLAGEQVANRSYLIDGGGGIVAYYDKIHMFDVDLGNGEVYRESRTYKPGARAVLAETPWGVLGMTVCYDLRFPAIYRQLAQAGATLLSAPSAFTRPTGEAHWETLLRARAIENGAYVFAPAQCGVHPGDRSTWGHSLIVDPWGRVLADGGEEPGFIVADIDPSRVEEARRSLPSLEHDRPFDSPVLYPRGSSGGSGS